MNKLFVGLFIFLFASLATAQNKNNKNTTTSNDAFNYAELESFILIGLNKIRSENNLDSLEKNDVLQKVSAKKVEMMTKADKAELKDKTETQRRAMAVGATKKVDEIVFSFNIKMGKKELKINEIADGIISKWKTNKKIAEVIKNPAFIYASPSTKLNQKGNKIYISVVFGNYYSFNTGNKKQKELEMPYSTSNKKIKPGDDRACANCKKFNDYDNLALGVYVEKGKIYFKYDNLKNFNRLIKRPTDGLAIDIIQRKQYNNSAYNIYDNNLLTKGIQLKPVTKSKLLSKNRVKPEKKGKRVMPVTKIDTELGILPPKIKGEYELNLLIIQDGKVCKTIYRSYIEQGDADNAPVSMLLMPEEHAYTKPIFEPQSESTLLSFVVPFDKNKSDYKPTDIQPFLDALQEPDFFVEGLYITAYSSIEGDANANATLQKKRAESIVKAITNMQQKRDFAKNIKTSDSWNLFQLELEDTEFDYLTKMTKEKAIHEINTKGLATKLEPYLAKERFAQIILDVTYDIKGEKEEKFSVSKFNQAVKKGDLYTAYKIQYYIGKQMKDKKYTDEALNKTTIPYEAKHSGLLNNKIVLKSQSLGNIVEQQDANLMDSLARLDPVNAYVAFNSVFCKVKLDTMVSKGKTSPEIQAQIDALYKLQIPKKYVDALNVEWQFRIIAANDTMKNGEKIVQSCINKIKSFYKLDDANWQSNLKLAYIFARFADYRYATRLLFPYVIEDNPKEEVVFAYISFCGKTPELYNSNNFVRALDVASKVNHERYCKLFGQPYLTFQVLDNPKTKEQLNKESCK